MPLGACATRKECLLARAYRDGPIGALIDEYERAAGELLSIVEDISDEAYELVRATETPDDDCRSIQSIMAHVCCRRRESAGIWRLESAGLWRPASALTPRNDVRGFVVDWPLVGATPGFAVSWCRAGERASG